MKRFLGKICLILIAPGVFISNGCDSWVNEYPKDPIDVHNVIAYTYIESGKLGNDVYCINPDTGKKQRITNCWYKNEHPRWSPDGSRLVIRARRKDTTGNGIIDDSDGQQICILDLKKKETLDITDNIRKYIVKMFKDSSNVMGYKFELDSHETFYDPVWITENKIGFIRVDGELMFNLEFTYCIMAYDTERDRLFFISNSWNKEGYSFSNPNWIHENDILTTIFKHKEFRENLKGGYKDLVRIGLLRRKLFYLTKDNGKSERNPQLSPNKRQVVYEEYDPEMKITYVKIMNTDGTESRILEKGQYPTFSPDGKRVAFVRLLKKENGKTHGYDIFVTNIDGTGLRRVTFDGGVKEDLAWSPK